MIESIRESIREEGIPGLLLTTHSPGLLVINDPHK